MKKTLLSAILIVLVGALHAQISDRLKEVMSKEQNQLITVKVLFSSQTSILEERRAWQSRGVPVAMWPRMVNRVLMKEAERAQSGARRLVENQPENHVGRVETFYIVNMMILEARPSVIHALYQLPDVMFIDMADEERELIEPVSVSEAEAVTQAGREPGLTAINAPPMWKLGYTGKGGIAYDYDTGVWPDHPTFKDRFLGNFAPMDQCWYGYYNSAPTGATGDHGTHVLGTMAGLDRQTNDTIGVAFGAYWIANDLIGNASVAADLPPLAEMVKGFEWALNPDGDTTTSDDVPDVINNSWRWRDILDTVQCGGFIVQLMNAIEAAGIANVFSGGNTGPNNVGVNAPQRINTSVVNTFTVGSVNGNVSFPYPISTFSTRGPTQCGGTGSILIHPEVVAPGQNVRSAWGSDSYNTISGTSMASPHVSGAILLLKEAFPQLSGDTLMAALYNSAIDLGAPGEDNTYGKGIIDVYAAFQALSQRYTAVDPNLVDWDLAIEGVRLNPSQAVICDAGLTAEVFLRNLGQNPVSIIDFIISVDGTIIQQGTFQVNLPVALQKGERDTISFPVNANILTGGGHELVVEASIAASESDLINNRWFTRFNIRASRALPFQEDFENGIGAVNWYQYNEDQALTWDTTRVPDGGGQKLAAYMNFLNYKPRNSQVDQLWTPQLVLPSAGEIKLKFDVAYQEYVPVGQLYDTLKVLVSTDCGATLTEVYNQYGPGLNTTGNTGPGFIPQNRSEWRRDSVSLTAFAGEEVLVIFEGVNRNGNDLFLDNISIYAGTVDPMSLPEESLERFTVYPNPAHNLLHIRGGEVEEPLEYRITDLSGKLISQGHFEPNAERVIEISDLEAGAYLMEISTSDFQEAHRFLKN